MICSFFKIETSYFPFRLLRSVLFSLQSIQIFSCKFSISDSIKSESTQYMISVVLICWHLFYIPGYCLLLESIFCCFGVVCSTMSVCRLMTLLSFSVSVLISFIHWNIFMTVVLKSDNSNISVISVLTFFFLFSLWSYWLFKWQMNFYEMWTFCVLCCDPMDFI